MDFRERPARGNAPGADEPKTNPGIGFGISSHFLGHGKHYSLLSTSRELIGSLTKVVNGAERGCVRPRKPGKA